MKSSIKNVEVYNQNYDEPNYENDIKKIKNILIENIDFIQQNSTKRSGGWISLSSRVLKIIKII